MNKDFESERLQSEVEENTKAITERAEALKKELQEARKALVDKDVELKSCVAVNDAKIQEVYY